MIRSRATLVALLALTVLGVAACGGSPTASPISDAKEILVRSVEAAQSAKTVHVKVELSGSLPMGDLSGLLGGFGLPGASAAPSPSAAASASGSELKLDGTTAEGDVDFEHSAAHIGFSAPALLGLTGDFIAVDGAAYVKVSLLGDQYQRLDSGAAGSASPSPVASPSPTAPVADQLQQALDALPTPPTKLADETCGDTTCYHVQLTLDQASAGALESLAPGVTGSGTVDVYVRQNDLRPSRIIFTGEGGSASGLTLTLTFSDWDKSVSIQAPPADQIGSGGLGIPSFALPSFPVPASP
jgi:hypothetical protein